LAQTYDAHYVRQDQKRNDQTEDTTDTTMPIRIRQMRLKWLGHYVTDKGQHTDQK